MNPSGGRSHAETPSGGRSHAEAPLPVGLAELRSRLDAVDYVVDDGLAMALFLTQSVGQPLLLEGEPGVGKTAAAKALAEALDTPLIRLQCYEGITAAEALYEWNYPKQLLAIRLAEASNEQIAEADLFTADYLLERPLLQALRHDGPNPPVLLIDEIDRADDEFEALLFEFLGEGTLTVPEVGTFTAVRPPAVVLTSNRSRELHDALKRRCFYHWIDYPSVDVAADIVRRRVPGSAESLVQAATAFVSASRALDLEKSPGIAEAIDWVGALSALGINQLDRGLLESGPASTTLGSFVKTPDDLAAVRAAIEAGDLDAAFPAPS